MPVTLTEKAASAVKKVYQENGMPETTCLRLAIKGGGCSGFSYVLDISPAPAEGDEVFESNGIRVIVDPKSCLYVNGTEIDYEDKLVGKGFIFKNPNAKGSCGCGSSFRA
jgi:iron-sulfur cluster assembly protein